MQKRSVNDGKIGPRSFNDRRRNVKLTPFLPVRTCLGEGLSSGFCITSRSRNRRWPVGLLKGLCQGGRFCGSVAKRREARGRHCGRKRLDVRMYWIISFYCCTQKTYVNSSLMGIVDAIARDFCVGLFSVTSTMQVMLSRLHAYSHSLLSKAGISANR